MVGEYDLRHPVAADEGVKLMIYKKLPRNQRKREGGVSDWPFEFDPSRAASPSKKTKHTHTPTMCKESIISKSVDKVATTMKKPVPVTTPPKRTNGFSANGGDEEAPGAPLQNRSRRFAYAKSGATLSFE